MAASVSNLETIYYPLPDLGVGIYGINHMEYDKEQRLIRPSLLLL